MARNKSEGAIHQYGYEKSDDIPENANKYIRGTSYPSTDDNNSLQQHHANSYKSSDMGYASDVCDYCFKDEGNSSQQNDDSMPDIEYIEPTSTTPMVRLSELPGSRNKGSSLYDRRQLAIKERAKIFEKHSPGFLTMRVSILYNKHTTCLFSLAFKFLFQLLYRLLLLHIKDHFAFKVINIINFYNFRVPTSELGRSLRNQMQQNQKLRPPMKEYQSKVENNQDQHQESEQKLKGEN